MGGNGVNDGSSVFKAEQVIGWTKVQVAVTLDEGGLVCWTESEAADRQSSSIAVSPTLVL